MCIKLIFLGSGSAFSLNNFHSNMLLEMEGNKRFLIDCGSDARLSLKRVGLGSRDITDVYISHLHADHVGGLEWIGFTNYLRSRDRRPNLFIHHTLAGPLWNNSLKAGMQSLAGSVASLETFFKIHKISHQNKFLWNGIVFETVQTIHTYNGPELNQSYGLFFRLNNNNVFITTDTQFVPQILMSFYKKADVIFHDCETEAGGSGVVHSRFESLVTLPPEIKKKIWLYHYNDGLKPSAKSGGFLGYVERGQVFEF